MSLSRPPEPTVQSLRDRIDTTGTEQFFDVSKSELASSPLVKQALPSYLWSHWKNELGDVSWPTFSSHVSQANWLAGMWLSEDAEWDEVVERAAEALDETVR